MGSFYTNYTLRGPSQKAVAAALAGRSALVTPEQNGCVVVFDEESEDQNQEVIAGLAGWLSEEFQCPVLAVLNHDDDILWYQLYLNGTLADEYDSSPGNFDADADADNEPAGGDAEKLCQAFGSVKVKEVAAILHPGEMDGDGYTFAMERHNDLAEALGLPEFSVGVGFEYATMGELPDGLDFRQLIKTKNLPGTETASRPAIGGKPEIAPGYYKVMIPSGQPGVAPTQSLPIGWLPGIWADLACPESELSKEFWQATAALRGGFNGLGFAIIGHKKLSRILNPSHRDSGGIYYIDSSRRQLGQVVYNKYHLAPQNADKETVVIMFAVGFGNEVLHCTNNTNDVLGAPANHTVIRLPSNDVASVYERFLAELKQRTEPPRQFPDLAAVQAWTDTIAVEALVDRVQRGLYVPMNRFEVAMAKRNLPAAEA